MLRNAEPQELALPGPRHRTFLGIDAQLHPSICSPMTSTMSPTNSPPRPTRSSICPCGQLDEAESAARDFLVRFPVVHDGYDRLGMVYEARGNNKQAAHYYRQVIDFVRARPDQYEPAFETTFQRLVQKLDPTPAD
jgi:hypothetical protein